MKRYNPTFCHSCKTDMKHYRNGIHRCSICGREIQFTGKGEVILIQEGKDLKRLKPLRLSDKKIISLYESGHSISHIRRLGSSRPRITTVLKKARLLHV